MTIAFGGIVESADCSVGTITDGTIPPGNDPNYIAGLQIQIPVFQGGALDNAVRSARQDVEAARAALQLQSDVVVSDVWNTYINVRTASQQIISSQALVRSAGLLDYWRAKGWPDFCRPQGADDFICN